MVDSTPGSGPEPSAVHSTPSGAAPPFQHRPVMVDEVVALIEPLPAGTFLDATLGGGGHAEAILTANSRLHLLGIDRDPAALAAAGERLERFGERVTLQRNRFDQIESSTKPLELSGFLFDLGVSSPQLDWAERGFSFRQDGPLDMRMDTDAALSADDVVNSYDQRDLAGLIRRNSDERFASRIAAAIVAARPLATTNQLAEIIVAAIPAPARRRGGHPAKRTFQAIRIEVNDELRILAPALEFVVDALVPGGRGIVITYHSGEDRIAKDVFRNRTAVEHPPGLPVEGPKPDFEIVRPMARRPSEAELADNPRATSARMRTIERVAA
ncbi:MAG: 16S rRNA (cytosine(1402)-N(4))-methyltransferase RsmH [Acidimicrobiales bacterium]